MTIERPMFPPVDPTRRRFLTVAAGASIASVGSLTVAAQGSTPEVSPALRTARQALDEAHGRLEIAQAAYEAADALFVKWERQNPQPKSKRGTQRWIKKSAAYHRKVTPKAWEALMQAEREFNAAQIAVACVPPAGTADIHVMAACSILYDSVDLCRTNQAPIGRAVALAVFRLGKAVQS